MNHIIVTNLYGSTNIDNNTPFILIKIKNTNHLVKRVDGDDNKHIFKFIPEYLDYVLKKFNLNPKSFVSSGDLFHDSEIFNTTNFLLVNKKYTKECSKFKKVTEFNNGTIYEPIPPKNFTSLGLFYSYRNFKITKCYVVDKYILEKSNNNINFLGKANTFHYLSSNSTKSYKPNNKIIKEMSKNNIVFNDYESYDSTESIDSWINKKGKKVILTVPDTPWYIDKGKKSSHINVKNIKPIFKFNVTGVDNNDKFKNNAVYKTSQKMDIKKHHLGFGYSMKDRLQGVNCDKKEVNNVYEMFTNQNNKKENNCTTFVKVMNIIMAIILLFLIIDTCSCLVKNLKKNN